MYNSMKQALEDIVVPNLNGNGFWGQFPTFYRKSNEYIEMIYLGLTQYKLSYVVRASIVYLNKDNDTNNINYGLFSGNIDEITPEDCRKIYFMKGSFGTDEFFFKNVYLALGAGVVGVGADGKKPIGIRLQKFNNNTYEKVCQKIKKRLPKLYTWLDKMKK